MPDKDAQERERYRELLAELRTIIPGAQVLFGFLLTTPFAARFSEVDGPGRIVFTVALVAVAVATILFLAPASYHRLAEHGDRRRRIQFGVRTALAGMALLAFSIVCAAFVVVRLLFGWQLAGVLVAAIAATVLLTWYVLPTLSTRGAPR